ncbi:hypothetical protein ACFQYP_13720 [Nonomuraea antimicrobica]
MLPLFTIDYDLGADPRNAVSARGRHTFAFGVRAPTGAAPARIAGAAAQVSYDDGATWATVRVDRLRDGTYQVKTDHKRRSGHVSLKVAAWDGSGNRVDQTIVRAFALK